MWGLKPGTRLRVSLGDAGGFLVLASLILLKFFLVCDQPIQVGEEFSSPWLSVFSAASLVKGEWLGRFSQLALQRPPGLAFWVAANYLLHLPLRWANEGLWIVSALALTLSAGRLGLPRIFRGLFCYVLLFAPSSFAVLQTASSQALQLAFAMLSLAATLFAARSLGGRARFAWILGSALCLAFARLCGLNVFATAALAGGLLLWEVFGPPSVAGAGLRPQQKWLLALLPLFVLVLTDLGVRTFNYKEYGYFVVSRHSEVYRLLKKRLGDHPAPDELFAATTRRGNDAARPTYYKAVGWVFRGSSPIDRMELLDDRGRVIGATDRFVDRSSVPEFFRERGRNDVPSRVGFDFDSEITGTAPEKLKLVFYDPKGRTEVAAANLQPVPPDLAYYLDALDKKFTFQVTREKIIAGNDWIYEYLRAILLYLAVLGAMLFAAEAWLDRFPPRAFDFCLYGLAVIGSAFTPAFSRHLRVADAFLWETPLLALGVLLAYRSGVALLRPETFGKPVSRVAAWLEALSPARAFLALALGFGLCFALANPPFQAADEGAHAYRSFQTSQGQPANAAIPASVPELVGRFIRLPGAPHNRIFFREIREALRVPWNDSNRGVFGSISLTWVPYVPQAAGIFLGKILHLPILGAVYLGRIFNLLAWTGLVYAALRALPFYRWVFFGLALSPMGLYQAASLSHDPFSNGFCFLLIATMLRYAYGPELRLTWRQGLWLAALGVAASLGKPVYFPVVGLYFLIPVRRVGSWPRYLFWFALVAGAAFAVDYGLAHWVVNAKVSTPSAPSNQTQFQFIRNNPGQYLHVLATTFSDYWKFYLKSYLGVLGWLDTELPFSLLAFYGFILVSLAWIGGSAKVSVLFRQRLLVALALVGAVLLLELALYLTWTPVGNFRIEGVQGRYFIPIGPLILLLFHNKKFSTPKLAALTPLAVSLVLAAAWVALVNRFYYFG